MIERVTTVSNEIVKGNFEARIIGIGERGKSAEAQFAVNDMIDRCDAFVREATASLEAVCRNVYYRKILLSGLEGSFRHAAQAINDSVAAQARAVEEARGKAAAELQRIVEAVGQGLGSLARGELTRRLSDLPAAYSQIEGDFNATAQKLQQALTDIIAGTRTIGAATREIAAGADDLSRRTEQQAAALEETAAALHEISMTVAETVKGAHQAAEAVSTAKSDAEGSGEIVRRAIDAMDRIETSSQHIAKIVGVIDEIAFQTNLLALNAGVEAARAGEAGRGFAVVASEVRALAQRSAQAAKEIKGLIAASSSEVREGVNRVVETRQAIEHIVAQVGDISQVIAAIATASNQQSTALQEINVAIGQMDQDTQKNAAMVEETTAATHSLMHDAEGLVSSVAEFDVGRNAAPSPPDSRRAGSGGARKAAA